MIIVFFFFLKNFFFLFWKFNIQLELIDRPPAAARMDKTAAAVALTQDAENCMTKHNARAGKNECDVKTRDESRRE